MPKNFLNRIQDQEREREREREREIEECVCVCVFVSVSERERERVFTKEEQKIVHLKNSSCMLNQVL